MMCAPNKTKKGNKAFIYLFHTYLSITISAMVSGRSGAMSRMEVFLHSNNQTARQEVNAHNTSLLTTAGLLNSIIY